MDRILCPYCPDGVPMRMAMGGTHMRCPNCQSTSPLIDGMGRKVDPAVVRLAAKRRYVPMLEKKWRRSDE